MCKLGEQFAAHLQRAEHDPLSVWMAHHVARLIVEAREAAPRAKNDAEERCRRAILDLWRARQTINEPRPLKAFDSVIETISGLKEPLGSWYLNHAARTGAEGGNETLQLAVGVDHAARIILRWCLALAALKDPASDSPWLDVRGSHLFDCEKDMNAVRALVADAEELGILGAEPKTDASHAARQDVRYKLQALAELAAKIAKTVPVTRTKKPSKARTGSKQKAKKTRGR